MSRSKIGNIELGFFQAGCLLALGISLGIFTSFYPQYVIYTVGVAGLIAITLIYRIGLFEYLVLLLPVMFYLNVGFNLNISFADFILPLLLLSMYKMPWSAMMEFFSKYRQYLLAVLGLMCAMSSSFLLSAIANVVDYRYGISNFIKITTCFVYFIVLLLCFHRGGKSFEPRFLKSWNFISVLFSLLCIIGVSLFYVGKTTGLTLAFRAQGTFEDPNLAAAYLILSLGICLTYNRLRGRRFGINILLIIIALFLTSSRGGVIGLLIGLVLSMIVIAVSQRGNGIKNMMKFITIAAIFVIVGTILLNLHVTFIETAVDRITQVGGNDPGTQNRLMLWETALELWQKNPLFGVGSGQYRTAASMFNSNIHNIPHNTYLGFLAETGALGFIALLSLPAFLIIKLSQRMKKGDAVSSYLFISLIALGVQAFSINIENFRVLWVYFAFALYWISKPIHEEAS